MTTKVQSPEQFQQSLLLWYQQYGRKNLPWQQGQYPYQVWVSEVMLQQTQVATVIPYYLRFMEHFPDLQTLANASQDAVLRIWAGLGYYARARNLHKSAIIINKKGYFPDDFNELLALPGIGRSTAGAIMAMAFKQKYPILDGNVKRVLTRFHALAGWPGLSAVSKQLWTLSDRYTPTKQIADFTQAMMDLGSLLCTRTNPTCAQCPVQCGCLGYANDLTAQLPTPRPRKKIPIKQAVFLIAKAEQQLLLEKRPNSGIWGGLWCFPQFESIDAALAWCHDQTISISQQHMSAQDRHIFTHFELHYQALVIQAKPAENLIMANGSWFWHDLQDLKKLAFPSPINRLIEHTNIQELYND